MKNNWKTWAVLGVVIVVAIVIGGYADDYRFKMSQKSAGKKNPPLPQNQDEPMYAEPTGY